MKKLYLSLVILITLMLSSCGKDCTSAEFIGTWKLDDWICGSATLEPAPLITFNPGGDEKSVNFAGIELLIDGCTLLIQGLGEYTAEDGNLRLTTFVGNCEAIYVRDN